MMAKPRTDAANKQYRKRKCTVEPVSGIVKSIFGFTRFQPRGIEKVKMEWILVALAYNRERLNAIGPIAITAALESLQTNISSSRNNAKPTDC